MARILRRADAVEVAHAIAELQRTRLLLAQLERRQDVIVPLDNVRLAFSGDGGFEDIEIPPHVLRYVAENGALAQACRDLINIHQNVLRTLAEIEISEET